MAFWLIENEEQLDYLVQKSIDEAFIEVIPYHNDIHPAINGVSLVYIKPYNDIKSYMICIDHSETFSINKTLINDLLKNINKIWVRNKKQTLYYFPLKQLHDLSILTPTYIPPTTPTHTFFYEKYPEYQQINKIIPISKHYERCQNIYNQISGFTTSELPPYFDFYNNKVTLAFFGIEKNGIQINKDEFNKHFKPNKEFLSIKDNRIYTQYNLATTTHRPSNAFNGINFAALNKDNGSRKSFISKHGFVEFDISAYHPTLISRIIKHKFDNDDIHQSFADLYNVDYQKSKELTFKQMYGGVFKEYEHLEFFQKIKQFIDNNWKEFNNSGQVIVPISGYCFEKNKLENMNPQKLFNYMLQNIESAVNTHILLDIHKLLRERKTKIVLYTYDSFLFQIGEDEEDIVLDIQKIFEKYKLNIKIKKGYDYDFE